MYYLWCRISLYDVSTFAMSFLFPLQFDPRPLFEVGVKPKFFQRENVKASFCQLPGVSPRPLGTKFSIKSPKQAVQAASGHSHIRPGLWFSSLRESPRLNSKVALDMGFCGCCWHLNSMFLVYLAISKVAFQDSGLSEESVGVFLGFIS